MKKKKSFNLLLLDGEITGRIKCTLQNWTGIAYKIPRIYINKSKERNHLNQSGVYFLFDSDKNEVYIGQAGTRNNGGGVLLRISEHLKNEKRYFNDVVVLTTQNDSFGATDISYLENKFMNLVVRERYKLINSNTPNLGKVTEEKESELDEFIEYSKIVLGILGYKIFLPLVENNRDELNNIKKNENLHLYLTRKIKKIKVVEAECIRTDEGFVVLKGSMFFEKSSKDISKSIAQLRDEAIKNNQIVDGKLIRDFLFTSPSSAASFVHGMAANGRVEWKTIDGKTLKQLED